MINQAMFQRNGRSGYLLKPPPLRSGGKAHLMQRGEHFLDVTVSCCLVLLIPIIREHVAIFR